MDDKDETNWEEEEEDCLNSNRALISRIYGD